MYLAAFHVPGCAPLTGQTDCSCNVYARGSHLLCHDDVIGTRCVSYILYLSRPGQQWVPRLGGALELYATDEAGGAGCSIARSGAPRHSRRAACLSLVPTPPRGGRLAASVGSTHPGGEVRPLGAQPPPRLLERAASRAAESTAFDHAGPATAPCAVVPCHWGTLLMFTVQPGVSFHAVAEVLSRGEPRLSVSGWSASKVVKVAG